MPQPGEVACEGAADVACADDADLHVRSFETGSFNAASTFAGRNGTERSRTPTASNTAFEIAAGTTAAAACPLAGEVLRVELLVDDAGASRHPLHVAGTDDATGAR